MLGTMEQPSKPAGRADPPPSVKDLCRGENPVVAGSPPDAQNKPQRPPRATGMEPPKHTKEQARPSPASQKQKHAGAGRKTWSSPSPPSRCLVPAPPCPWGRESPSLAPGALNRPPKALLDLPRGLLEVMQQTSKPICPGTLVVRCNWSW